MHLATTATVETVTVKGRWPWRPQLAAIFQGEIIWRPYCVSPFWLVHFSLACQLPLCYHADKELLKRLLLKWMPKFCIQRKIVIPIDFQTVKMKINAKQRVLLFFILLCIFPPLQIQFLFNSFYYYWKDSSNKYSAQSRTCQATHPCLAFFPRRK